MSKHEVFREHLSSIQTSIQTSVCDVAEKCWTRGMIAESVYQSVVYGVKTPGEKTRELLSALSDQIKNDEQLGQASSESRFDKFLKILEKDAVHNKLVESLRDAWRKKLKSKIESGTTNQVTGEESSPAGQSAISQLVKSSEEDSVDSGFHLEPSFTDDSADTEITTVLSSESDLAGLPECSTSLVQQLKRSHENTDGVVPEFDTTPESDETEGSDFKPVEETELDTTNSTLVVKKKPLYPLEKKLLEAASEARELHTEKDRLEYERDQETRDYEKKLQDVASEARELQTENEKLKHDQDQVNIQLLKTEQQLKHIEEELKQTKVMKDSEAKSYEEKISELEAEILKIKKSVEELQQELDVQQTLQEKNEQVNEANVTYIEGLKRKIAHEIAQKEEAEQELDEIKMRYVEEVARHSSLVEQLTAEKLRLEKERDEQIVKLKRENVQLESQVTGIKQERDHLRRLSLHQGQTIGGLEAKNETLCWCLVTTIMFVIYLILFVIVGFYNISLVYILGKCPDSPDHSEL